MRQSFGLRTRSSVNCVSLVPALTACLLLGEASVAQTPRWHVFPVPAASSSHGLAFDHGRERMVMFESAGWANVARTWEWVGDDWSLRRPAMTPPPRQEFSLGYDPIRRRVVMFGGSTQWLYSLPGALLADTWEYDGVDWTQRAPVVSPPPQKGGWLGFDYANNQLLLCGSSGAPPGSWLYDGTTWTSVPFAPFYASLAGFASDPIRQRVVAVDPSFSGIGVMTYEWDGTSWTPRPSAHSPPQRHQTRAVYVIQRQAVVLHGGYSGVPATYAADLWQWDGVDWSQLAGPPAPQRYEHHLEHDPFRNRTFVVGGSTPNNLATETQQWDGVNWYASSPTLGWDLLTNAYFDGNRQRVVAFNFYPATRLEWDGVRWDRAPAPIGPLGASLAFDAQRQRAVALSAFLLATGLATTEWDGVNWSAPVPAALPCAARLIYHTGLGRVMACCGSGGLWQWDGVVWTQVAAGPGGPWSAVADAQAVYDPSHNEVVVWTWQAGTLFTATWNGVAWTLHSTGGGPPDRTKFAPGFDDSRGRVVMFGGSNGSVSFGDLWEWDGVGWSQRLLANPPPARESAALVFDPVRQQLLLVSGRRQLSSTASQPLADLWAIDSLSLATATTVGLGCGGSGGVPVLHPAALHPGADFTLDLFSGLPDAPCIFGLGYQVGAVPVGANCIQYLSNQDQLVLGFTNSGGFGSLQWSIPIGMQGFAFVAQAAVLDATNPLGVSLTPGLSLVVGY